MHDVPDNIDEGSGERLTGDAFGEYFDRDLWKTGEPGLWKLERIQKFQEPDDESWIAFANGEWEEAIRLNEAERPSLVDYLRTIAEYGFSARRVRVVEKPITPYLQWELHALRLRNRLDGSVRV
ncbi:MAG: DUF6879 family protein, partial [Sciscionella sp.]